MKKKKDFLKTVVGKKFTFAITNESKREIIKKNYSVETNE